MAQHHASTLGNDRERNCSETFATAVALLRAASGRHPDDAWVNHTLAKRLGELRPAPREEQVLLQVKAHQQPRGTAPASRAAAEERLRDVEKQLQRLLAEIQVLRQELRAGKPAGQR